MSILSLKEYLISNGLTQVLYSEGSMDHARTLNQEKKLQIISAMISIKKLCQVTQPATLKKLLLGRDQAYATL